MEWLTLLQLGVVLYIIIQLVRLLLADCDLQLQWAEKFGNSTGTSINVLLLIKAMVNEYALNNISGRLYLALDYRDMIDLATLHVPPLFPLLWLVMILDQNACNLILFKTVLVLNKAKAVLKRKFPPLTYNDFLVHIHVCLLFIALHFTELRRLLM